METLLTRGWTLTSRQEATSQREETFRLAHVGRLVWKQFLRELTECAHKQRLEISYQTKQHMFSVGLIVTGRGNSPDVTRFAGSSDALLFR